jgi:hypothetical protein
MSKKTTRPEKPRGRPPISASGTEAVNFLVAIDDMDRVRAELERLGAGATLAGWMRDAIREKLQRDAPQGYAQHQGEYVIRTRKINQPEAIAPEKTEAQ